MDGYLDCGELLPGHRFLITGFAMTVNPMTDFIPTSRVTSKVSRANR